MQLYPTDDGYMDVILDDEDIKEVIKQKLDKEAARKDVEIADKHGVGGSLMMRRNNKNKK